MERQLALVTKTIQNPNKSEITHIKICIYIIYVYSTHMLKCKNRRSPKRRKIWLQKHNLFEVFNAHLLDRRKSAWPFGDNSTELTTLNCPCTWKTSMSISFSFFCRLGQAAGVRSTPWTARAQLHFDLLIANAWNILELTFSILLSCTGVAKWRSQRELWLFFTYARSPSLPCWACSPKKSMEFTWGSSFIGNVLLACGRDTWYINVYIYNGLWFVPLNPASASSWISWRISPHSAKGRDLQDSRMCFKHLQAPSKWASDITWLSWLYWATLSWVMLLVSLSCLWQEAPASRQKFGCPLVLGWVHFNRCMYSMYNIIAFTDSAATAWPAMIATQHRDARKSLRLPILLVDAGSTTFSSSSTVLLLWYKSCSRTADSAPSTVTTRTSPQRITLVPAASVLRSCLVDALDHMHTHYIITHILHIFTKRERMRKTEIDCT